VVDEDGTLDDLLGRPTDALVGRPDDGAGVVTSALVGSGLGTVRVVKRVVVSSVVEVESVSGTSLLPLLVGLGASTLLPLLLVAWGTSLSLPLLVEWGTSTSVMGQTVVETAMVSVVTWPTGQSVTVAEHEVMV
jgi:hypothetical protein